MEKVNGSRWEGKHVVCLNPYTNTYIAVWGFKELSDNSFEYSQEWFKNKPSLEEIKKVIINYHNDECSQEILSGLKYEGNVVWLSTENQLNYKSALDFALQNEGSNLPVKVKLGSDDAPVYVVFETIESLKGFVNLITNHITTTLEKWWEIKDSIDWSLYELEN